MNELNLFNACAEWLLLCQAGDVVPLRDVAPDFGFVVELLMSVMSISPAIMHLQCIVCTKNNDGCLLHLNQIFFSPCLEWLLLCQAGGVVPLGDLAAQFGLGAELLLSVVTPRMNKTIHGRLEGGLLYTSAYIARIKAQVFAAFA